MTPGQMLHAYTTGATMRYHTSPQMLHQRVDAHTWGVAALLAMAHPAPSSALLKAALFHDMGERYGPGDINFFAKIQHPALGVASQEAEEAALLELKLPEHDLTDEERVWLKWADATEVALHAVSILHTTGAPCAKRLLKSALDVMKSFDLNPVMAGMHNRLCLEWEIA